MHIPTSLSAKQPGRWAGWTGTSPNDLQEIRAQLFELSSLQNEQRDRQNHRLESRVVWLRYTVTWPRHCESAKSVHSLSMSCLFTVPRTVVTTRSAGNRPVCSVALSKWLCDARGLEFTASRLGLAHGMSRPCMLIVWRYGAQGFVWTNTLR